jgi:hypothetical protein
MMTPLDSTLYDVPANGQFYSPFDITIQPMRNLQLINMERDPDRLYVGFEPQTFDDSVHGKGFIVLAYRHDKKVDVYHQPSVHLKPETYDIVGAGLGEMFVRPFEGAHITITACGIDTAFAFADKEGRVIQVAIKETDGKPCTSGNILAPLGISTEKPPGLPLLFLYRFDFVRRSKTDVRIVIDGISHEIDPFPIPMNGARVYYSRYTASPFIVTWNPTFDGVLPCYYPNGSRMVSDGQLCYELEENSGHYEISRMQAADGEHTVSIRFEPPVPDVVALHDGAQAEGKFTINCTPDAGLINGDYRINRRGDTVEMEIVPSGGWKPGKSTLSWRIAFFIVKMLRVWPKSYRWSAQIRLASGHPNMRAAWERLTNSSN